MGDPSWLTDKELTHWQPTNPRGFADWFREISAAEHHQRKLEAAKRAEVQVDEFPDDQIKTSLQLTVQLLERHRDHMFRGDPDRLAPPSAVITALASQAYQTQTPPGRPRRHGQRCPGQDAKSPPPDQRRQALGPQPDLLPGELRRSVQRPAGQGEGAR